MWMKIKSIVRLAVAVVAMAAIIIGLWLAWCTDRAVVLRRWVT